MADHVSTVAGIYAAFGRGDVGAILDQLADDVVWEGEVRDTGLAYLRERHGRDAVAGFFVDLAATLNLTHFEPMAFCADGDFVAVPVRYEGEIVGGGAVPMSTEVHLWRLGADGKVVAFNHYLDIAVHEDAASERARALQGAVLSVVGDTVQVDRAGGRFELFEVSGPAESGPPPHAHPWDEVYIGLDGEVEVMLDGSVSTLRTGDIAIVPAGALHCYRVLTETARFRVISSGHRASLFFADLDRNAAHGTPTAETLPGIVDVARRNGLSSPLFV